MHLLKFLLSLCYLKVSDDLVSDFFHPQLLSFAFGVIQSFEPDPLQPFGIYSLWQSSEESRR